MSKKKAKEVEETKKLPKNPNEYSYRGDEDIVMKAKDFLLFAQAIETAIQNGVKVDYPTVVKYIGVASGVDVEKPTEKAIKEGKVRPIMDIDATFADSNLSTRYEPWLIPTIVDAKQRIFEIHKQNVELGNAIPASVINEERRAAQAKAQERPQDPIPPEENLSVDSAPMESEESINVEQSPAIHEVDTARDPA